MICVDNMVLVWGVRGQAVAAQEDMVARAQAFFTRLAAEHETVIVPAPVMSEFLTGTALDVQDEIAGDFSRDFQIPVAS